MARTSNRSAVIMMDRRTFIGAFAGALLAAPMAAQAQPQTKAFRIGILGGYSVTSPEAVHIWDGFFQGLRELGYVEGRDIVIEGRYYGDSVERLPALAAELVRLQVDVIGLVPHPHRRRPSARRQRFPSS